MKAGTQTGWLVTSYVRRAGIVRDVRVGVYEAFMDADQAADGFFSTTAGAERCCIEKHYKEDDDDVTATV